MSLRLASYSALLLLASVASRPAAAVPLLEIVTPSPITGSLKVEPGFGTPQGGYAAYTNLDNLALGAPVAVSDTISGFPVIHNAGNLTDGNFGNGRSWIGIGTNSWLTVNLGVALDFNTILFGRDQLGYLSDRDPGQFVISISSDNLIFAPIFNSSSFGFSGNLSAAQTIRANFNTVHAQYVRLQLASAGSAIDEIEIENIPAPVPIFLIVPFLAWLGLSTRAKKVTGVRSPIAHPC